MQDELWKVCRKLPDDYEPYGEIIRWADPSRDYPDCSCGCRFFRPLYCPAGTLAEMVEYEGPDVDWGVCANPESHRAGLLTFEHQGCGKFSRGETVDGQQTERA